MRNLKRAIVVVALALAFAAPAGVKWTSAPAGVKWTTIPNGVKWT